MAIAPHLPKPDTISRDNQYKRWPVGAVTKITSDSRIRRIAAPSISVRSTQGVKMPAIKFKTKKKPLERVCRGAVQIAADPPDKRIK